MLSLPLVPVITMTDAVVPTRSLTSVGHFKKANTHRDPLGQPNPLKGWTDTREKFISRAAVILGNTPAKTLHAAF